jgi:hypothetical protein
VAAAAAVLRAPAAPADASASDFRSLSPKRFLRLHALGQASQGFPAEAAEGSPASPGIPWLCRSLLKLLKPEPKPVGMTGPVLDLAFGTSGAKPRPRSQTLDLAKNNIWDAGGPVRRLSPTTGFASNMQGRGTSGLGLQFPES